MAESSSAFPTHVQSRLAGRVAVVTGANRGIGFAVARTLAAEACSLVITGRDAQKLAKAAEALKAEFPHSSATQSNPQVVAIVCDVRDAAAVQRLFHQVNQQFANIDILVNNAGIWQSPAPVEETSIQLWRDIIDVNLTGTFLCTRFGLPLMKRGSTILNVISIGADDCFANYSPYNASKAGALAFTRTLREELKDRGIRVTALVPGGTNTDMWEQVMPDAPRDQLIEAETLATLVLQTGLLSEKANLTELRLDAMGGPF